MHDMVFSLSKAFDKFLFQLACWVVELWVSFVLVLSMKKK